MLLLEQALLDRRLVLLQQLRLSTVAEMVQKLELLELPCTRAPGAPGLMLERMQAERLV
jgi:hypothetical protein